MNETEGLEARYHVEKMSDPTGKHDECRYFVLDPQHDPVAREALRDYAVHALSYGHLRLYQDLDRWLTRLDREGGPIPPTVAPTSHHNRAASSAGRT
jgi:hypothetical protein